MSAILHEYKIYVYNNFGSPSLHRLGNVIPSHRSAELLQKNLIFRV